MFFLLAALLDSVAAQYPMPSGCGGCTAACAPRICSQAQPMCPPPAPCPPQFCPPPPICPPPPPPPAPCPPPPACAPRPIYYQSYQPPMFQPPPVVYQPVAVGCGGGGGGGVVAPMPRFPAQNDCCCGCSSPCKYRGRAKAAGVKVADPTCSNEKLRDIINENIVDDATDSKRLIQTAAEEKLGHMVNVICGRGEFSYIAHTDTFCQSTKDTITCYVFKPL